MDLFIKIAMLVVFFGIMIGVGFYSRKHASNVDGFVLGKHTRFTSIDDQAAQVVDYVKAHFGGHIDCVYGLSLGGKILSRVMERGDIVIDHAILDGAPLLPLPRWMVGPLRYLQALRRQTVRSDLHSQ